MESKLSVHKRIISQLANRVKFERMKHKQTYLQFEKRVL